MSTLQTFETERLLLRPTAEADAAFMLELLNSPKWLQFIGDRQVYTIADARRYIRNRILPQLQQLGFSNYTVVRKQDAEKLGVCGLYDREGLEGIDIGFAFLPAYEGQGYALEAALALKQAATTVFGLTQIRAITSPANLASQKLLTKLGLTFKETLQLPNDAETLLLYEFTLQP